MFVNHRFPPGLVFGWLEGSNVGPLGRTVELLDNPFDMLAPPTPSLTLPLKGEGR